MNYSRSEWEARAKRMGASLPGVLFKGLTDDANGALHAWHATLVERVLAPRIREAGCFADLGCGYGRLAKILAAARPDLFLIGQDISHRYCLNFSDEVGPAVQADVAALPFRDGALAGAMAVTSLMYVDRHRLRDVLSSIRGLLEPGAPFLVVDPGEESRSVMARIGGARVRSGTGGSGFWQAEYQRIATDSGFEVVMAGGNPRDSALIAATAGGRIAWKLLSKVLPRDDENSGYSRFCLHRWLLLVPEGA